MPTTPRHLLPTPADSDAPTVPADLTELADVLDVAIVKVYSGTGSPPASPPGVQDGDLYAQYT